jgi:16S rRNA (guanine527-N7)-methyltransferase
MDHQDGPGTSADHSDHLRRYVELLRASPHNLLSARGLEEVEARHIPEALAFAGMLPSGPRLLDVGSGGGLPGIVIAIARPDLSVHLMEATGKKADFLTEVARDLALDVAVHRGRAEEHARTDLRGSFDLVTARAVAPLDRLIPWTAPFLRVGGQLHAIKGERWPEELRSAGSAMQRGGLALVTTPPPPAAGREGHEASGSLGPLVVVLERRR